MCFNVFFFSRQDDGEKIPSCRDNDVIYETLQYNMHINMYVNSSSSFTDYITGLSTYKSLTPTLL